MDNTAIIEATLRELGIGSNYIAQQRVVTAIALALEDEDRLFSVTRKIYAPAGERCGCSWAAVERNIRTTVQRVWRINPQGLIKMAGYPLAEPPTASDFIEIVAHYPRRTIAGEKYAATPE